MLVIKIKQNLGGNKKYLHKSKTSKVLRCTYGCGYFVGDSEITLSVFMMSLIQRTNHSKYSIDLVIRSPFSLYQ